MHLERKLNNSMRRVRAQIALERIKELEAQEEKERTEKQ